MGVIRISWLAALVALLAASDAARARPRLRPVSEDEQLLYRPDDRAGDQQLLYVPADSYDNLYAARAAERIDDDYAPRGAPRQPAPRVKEQPKQPPVQTIRNYNKVNDDGSFTFGYEAADGSFKEETRGTDCVVRGKYGYVDPDGNKREFSYVSGNPCDPNAPSDDDGENGAESNEADDEPANYPARPVQARPTTQRAPTTYFQNQYRNEEEQAQEEPEEEPLQHIRQRVVQHPQYPQRARPAYAPVAITPRPLAPVTTLRPLPPATTFRPQYLQVTPKPQITYSPALQTPIAPRPQPAYHTTPRTASIDFAAEFAKFQQENQIPSSSPASPARAPAKVSQAPSATGNPIYSTELVYDPSSGQYDTQLYQTLPQTKGEFNLNQRLQPYVAQQQSRPFVPSQQLAAAQPPPLYRHQIQHQQQAPQRNPQELYQRQQNEQQFTNSAQLFAQQQQLQQSQLQKDRAAARAQAQRIGGGGGGGAQPQPQQFYYVAPQRESSGQIDAFLRGHGIQF